MNLSNKVALAQAFLADCMGNLYYALTARNFNPVMALAADTVIVDAENIVMGGAMDLVVTKLAMSERVSAMVL